MIYFLAFIVLIGVIVFVHELGHFWAARSVGVGVERFSIGMPPNFVDFTKTKKGLVIELFFFAFHGKRIKWKKVFSKTFTSLNTPSETVYTIGLLPLGGYVKMKGILDESMDSEFKGADDELESKSALQKIWVMSAGVIMNLILTFFIFVLIGNINGDTVLETNDTVVDYVVPEQSAEIAGILVGDQIMSINNIAVDTWNDAVLNIQQHPNKNISIVVERNNELLTLNALLGSRPNFETGRIDQQIGTLGISKSRVQIKLNFQESIVYGFERTKTTLILMTYSLKMIFQGNVSRNDVGSIIKIGEYAGQAAQQGLVSFLSLMALLSVNIAYINILPIPGLDGGHIALILTELLMGRKLSVKTRIRIQTIGMIFLLSLMFFLIGNDISSYFFKS